MKSVLTKRNIILLLAAFTLTFVAFYMVLDSVLILASFPYAAVLWPEGSPNMGGTTNRAYFVPLSAIATFPAFPESPTEAGEFHTLAGELTLNAETNVVELYASYKSGTLNAEVEGEIDGKFFKLTPEFFHPGNQAEVVNFATSCVNTPGILFLAEKPGKYLVVGSPGHPVYLSPSFELGKVGEGRKGTTFTGEAYSEIMLTRFEGTLPLTATS